MIKYQHEINWRVTVLVRVFLSSLPPLKSVVFHEIFEFQVDLVLNHHLLQIWPRDTRPHSSSLLTHVSEDFGPEISQTSVETTRFSGGRGKLKTLASVTKSDTSITKHPWGCFIMVYLLLKTLSITKTNILCKCK